MEFWTIKETHKAMESLKKKSPVKGVNDSASKQMLSPEKYLKCVESNFTFKIVAK